MEPDGRWKWNEVRIQQKPPVTASLAQRTEGVVWGWGILYLQGDTLGGIGGIWNLVTVFSEKMWWNLLSLLWKRKNYRSGCLTYLLVGNRTSDNSYGAVFDNEVKVLLMHSYSCRNSLATSLTLQYFTSPAMPASPHLHLMAFLPGGILDRVHISLSLSL